MSQGTHCPMRGKKGKQKCIFAHGPVELRVKDGKRERWGTLVDKKGNCANPNHSGGEDTYGAARSVEVLRKEEGKWGNFNGAGGNSAKGSKGARGGNNYRGKNHKQPSRRVGS